MGNTTFVLAMIATAVAAGTWLYKYFKGDDNRGGRHNYIEYEYDYDDYYDRSHSYYDYTYDDYDWYDDNINYYAYDQSVNNQNVVSTVSRSTSTKEKRKRKRRKRKSRKNTGVECTICLNSVQDRKKKLLCGHFFHVRCIERWFLQERSCPNCRQLI